MTAAALGAEALGAEALGAEGLLRAGRVALVSGTRTFGEGLEPLPSVPDELRLMKAVLAESADCVIHTDSRLDPDAAHVVESFERALEGDGTPPDLLIFYYSGHALDDGKGNLYIAAHGSDRDRLTSMFRPDHLVDILLAKDWPRPREVVIMLDNCWAGLSVSGFKKQQGELEKQGHAMPVLTAFGSVDRVQEAQQLHFVESFAHAVGTAPAQPDEEFISMQMLFDQLSVRMRKLRTQGEAPRPQFLPPTGPTRAFPNPWYMQYVIRRPREAKEGSGWAFCGRAAAADTVISFLTGDKSADCLAVTGGAGSGKSMLLDWIHTAAQGDPLPAGPDAPPVAPPASLGKLIDMRGRSVAVAVSRVAAAYGIDNRGDAQALVEALGKRPGPLTICLDSVDACADPDRLYAELIMPLAALDQIRVVFACSEPPQGFTGPQVDLDSEEYVDPDGIAEFVTHVLRSRRDTKWTYAEQGWIADIARDTAQAAGHSWLRAYLFAVSLSADDPHTARVRAERTTAELFLEQLGTLNDEGDTQWAADLLLPVALAQGEGLPADGRLWNAVVRAGGRPVTQADLTLVQEKASDYLAAPEGGMYGHGWRFERSPHARYLAESVDEQEAHARFVDAMTALLPVRSSGALDWAAADRYTREHFAHHARLAGRLTDFLDDPEFLLMMNSEALHRALTVLHDKDGLARLRTLCAALADSDRTDGHTLSRMALLAQVHRLPELARRASQSVVGWQPTLIGREPAVDVFCLPDGRELLVDVEGTAHRTRGRGDHPAWDEVALPRRTAQVTAQTLADAGGEPALFAGQIDGTAWMQILDDPARGQVFEDPDLRCRIVGCAQTEAGLLIAGTDGWFWRHDRKNRRVVRPRGLRFGGAAAAVRHDGTAMVAARTARDVTVWGADGTYRHHFELDQKARGVTAIAADADGVYTGAGDGSVYRTDWDDPERRAWITTHDSPVTELRVRRGADGPLLISAGQRGDIRLTSLGPRRTTAYYLELGLDVSSVDVDTRGRIVVGSTAGVIRIAR
ncbi:caspase family protein [Streptomyces sp. NPDC096205]|uniref:caspase family protein n=1 Tax=Streptomyces sp. NPDC096205 TaxID=3366081 RepID=UPI00380A1A7E